MNIRKELELARRGNVESQEQIAWCYHIGEGVKKSEKKSFYWSLKAAMSGLSPVSSYNVSIAYFNGEGVKSDDKLAFFWARRSAAQGLPEGYFACGVHYLYGYGVKPNTRRAIQYLVQAYRMGYMAEAAKLLAKIYTVGIGIGKLHGKAFYWTSRAAVHSKDSDMFYNLGLFYLNGTGTTKNMVKAFLWTKKSAKYNNIDGLLATGWHYLNGIGVCANWNRQNSGLKNVLPLLPVAAWHITISGIFSCMNITIRQKHVSFLRRHTGLTVMWHRHMNWRNSMRRSRT